MSPADRKYGRCPAWWSVSAFTRQAHNDIRHRAFPVRWLRHWFMDHFIQRDGQLRKAPLRICEVGVGGGTLLQFVVQAYGARPAWITAWDAFSRCIDQAQLTRLGYDTCVEVNIEQLHTDEMKQYDVLVLSHVLEHLYEPEAAIARLLKWLRPGGILIGGHPTLPDLLRPWREQQLRRDAAPFGHVSVLSPKRIRRLAEEFHLSVEMLTGAYLIRMTGSRAEQSPLWLRLNLWFGALCPWWPGEVYWILRKH